MRNRVSTVTLDDLICAVLTGQNYDHRLLITQARRYARKISNIYASDLAEDVHEEVFNQAFVELFEAGPEALAKKSGKVLFRGAVMSALRIVRTNYVSPGQRTRPSKKLDRERVAAEDVGRIPDATLGERRIVADARALDFELIEDVCAIRMRRQIEDHLEIVALMKTAPDKVSWALDRIYFQDQPVGAVAKQLGLSRFALSRQIDTFCARWRMAA